MFSPRIQNLINSSGQQAAIQRYAELQAKAGNIQQAMEPPKSGDIKSFSKVLKESDTSPLFGSVLTPESTTSNNKIYDRNDLSALIGPQNSSNGNFASKIGGTKSQILDMVTKISKRHGVDDKLVKALIKQESGFKTDAKSHVGALGLMQLMPATARGLGVNDPMNPVENVDGGVRYLKSMLEKYNGNVVLALAAYNAGPGAVDKYDGVPPYTETQNYVKSILRDYL